MKLIPRNTVFQESRLCGQRQPTPHNPGQFKFGRGFRPEPFCDLADLHSHEFTPSAIMPYGIWQTGVSGHRAAAHSSFVRLR
jgi:hypothetical protein